MIKKIRLDKIPKSMFLPKVGIALVLPVLLIRIFTGFYPILYNIYISFTNYSMMNPYKYSFTLRNFLRIIHDSNVGQSVVFTVIYTVAYVSIVLVSSLLLANFLNLNFPGRNIIRTIALLPWAVAPVVTGIIASSSLNDDFGFIPDILYRIFPMKFNILGSVWGARIAVILWATWRDVGFWALIFLAALQTIPLEIIEASKVDGANVFQLYFKIKIPLIKIQILTMLLFSVLWTFLSFDLIFALTGGGPGYATTNISVIVYKTFIGGNFSYASTQIIALFSISIILLGFGIFYINKQRAEY